ncbi:glycine zipper 2TM domain-containing protein [Phenylobacterium aquaticum]|uniref:glycine zipper 2TM domain-containing protein n=1 Tax=Phenylobacterium aquaticum TaxID=1763816 RepID=UPI001F5D53BE|nr:glycine zipper 2TM domain-containing protein [Phenylobacterium aquaticum]MCI3133524.1 glycine zipper 2TM domain-containing protein [Phenylobacterium aquaticum]
MSIRSNIAKATLTGVAGVMALSTALAIPTFAAAQGGGYYGSGSNYSYDPCRRDTTTRGTTGALVGAALGAALGSNVASHHGGRKGGALLGGALGAVVGSQVGKNSAACEPEQRQGYYGNSQYGSNDYGYGSQAYGYQGGYYGNSGYYGGPRGRYGDSYNVDSRQQADANGCTLAESPIYLPDGRTQKRFVRVCPDASGHYQVVD